MESTEMILYRAYLLSFFNRHFPFPVYAGG